MKATIKKKFLARLNKDSARSNSKYIGENSSVRVGLVRGTWGKILLFQVLDMGGYAVGVVV